MNKWFVVLVVLAVLLAKGWLLTALSVLAIIGVIATAHEFGHFIVAKAVGVRVDEFALGLGGTRLLQKQIGETEYSVRTIPLGAFVKPAGMDPEEEYAKGQDPGERSFARKGLAAKLAILVAGSAANVLLTVVLASGIYYFIGERPSTIVVTNLLKDKPAHVAGVRVGDVFLEVDGIRLREYMQGVDVIGKNPGRKITVKIQRPSDPAVPRSPFDVISLQVVPEANEQGQGKIGILVDRFFLDEAYVKLPLALACREGLLKTLEYGQFMYQMALGMFRRAFTRFEVPKEVGGPVQIANVIRQIETLEDFLRVTAGLSLSIGVFNLLPIPALDGGRIFIMLVGGLLQLFYMLLRREVPAKGVISPRLEEFVHLAGFAFLIFMLVAVTWKDTRDLYSPPTQLERLQVKESELVRSAPPLSLTTAVPSPAGTNP